MKNQYIQGEDGSRMWTGFFDTERNETCTFRLAEDGQLRCLPDPGLTDFTFDELYDDASCANRIAQSPKDCPVGRYVVHAEGITCPSRFIVYPVMSSFIPTQVFYKPSNGGCAATPSTLHNYYTYNRVGSKLAPASFVAGAVAHE